MAETKKVFKILCIDGGGIRGIIPATILAKIEEITEKRIAELFDLVAGTSTGGIIASGLLKPDPNNPQIPEHTAQKLLDLYLSEGKEIFQKRFGIRFRGVNLFNEGYRHDGLEGLLNKYFGDARLKDALKPLVVVSYDLEGRKPFYFKSRLAKENPNEEDFLLREVTRATSAAPTYFEPKKLRNGQGQHYTLVDGGVCANNPSIVAYGEAEEILRRNTVNMLRNQTQSLQAALARGLGVLDGDVTPGEEPLEYFMLSIGTGSGLQPYPYEKSINWGGLSWIQPVVDVMMQGSAEVNHNMMKYILPDSKLMKHYVRLDVEKIDPMSRDMANVEQANIKKLEQSANELLKAKAQLIADVCKFINK